MLSDYASRVAHQIRQFSDRSKLLKLPPIHHYWMRTHIAPRFRQVLRVDSSLHLYANTFASRLAQSGGRGSFLSLGSGDCEVEIAIAKRLLQMGTKDFTLTCTDLSEVRLERAKELARKEGVVDQLAFAQMDLNAMDHEGSYQGVMAHHILHHVVELETLFRWVRDVLAPKGAFVSIDMIGRNGHMRWPEALEIINAIWAFLPDRYKYQHQFKRLDKEFVNWDCSTKGFEGIRAQDILPLLVGSFGFESFFAYGNLVDVFIERGYGHNFDDNDEHDRRLIDFIEMMNTLLIDLGYLKPTIMFAVMTPEKLAATRCWRHWTPEFCVRDPARPFRSIFES